MNKSPQFPVTRWTRIFEAADGGHASFSDLCQAYCYPIFHHFRRLGRSYQEAEDLTQDFLAFAFQQRALARADRTLGRFRNYLMRCLTNYNIDRHRAETAVRQGGGFRMVAFDEKIAESRFLSAQSTATDESQQTPEQIFYRQFAMEVLNNAIRELADEAAEDGKRPIFEAVREFITGDEKPTGYQSIAAGLGVPVNTLKSHVSRFRERYYELIREQVRDIVGRPSDVDNELDELRDAL